MAAIPTSLLLPGLAAVAILGLAILEPKLGLFARLRPIDVEAKGETAKTKKSNEHLALPDPESLLEFDLETAKVRDHIYVNKTIRYPYFQTMAHQPMHINNWIEIDSDYKEQVAYKREVVAKIPEKTVLSLPENDEGAGELLDTLVDYLPKRFPTLFDALPNGGIYNKILDERHENCGELKGVPALKVIACLVQTDFLMGRERDDGHIYFTGGLVAVPGFYDFSAKINQSMFDIHVGVPQFNEKILVSVERTLKRFRAHEPFERSSWEIVDDKYSHHHGIADLDPDKGDKLREDLEPKDYIFRIDHQTFRKLPKTNAIIFSVHPILRRLETLADLPLVPALLATVHEKAPADLMKYKLAPVYQDKMLPYLRQLTQSQIDRGLIKGDEEVSTFRDLATKA